VIGCKHLVKDSVTLYVLCTKETFNLAHAHARNTAQADVGHPAPFIDVHPVTSICTPFLMNIASHRNSVLLIRQKTTVDLSTAKAVDLV